MRVYCAGMIRSGSTWQYNVTSELLEHCEIAKRLGFAESESTLKRWISLDTNAVIKVHQPYNSLINDVGAGRARVVYIYRDLRDVAASLMQHQERDLQSILASDWLERIWHTHEIWLDLPGILVQRYEDMLVNTLNAARQIVTFLELDIDEAPLRVIDKRNLLETRRAELMSRRSVLDPLLHPLRAATGRTLRWLIGREATSKMARPFGYLGKRGVDPHTHLHPNHIANGRVGSYRKVMTPQEQEEIDQVVTRITDP